MKNINQIPPRLVGVTDALCGIQENGETIMATGILGINEAGDVMIPRNVILDIGRGIVSKGSPENPQSKTILMRKAYYDPDTGVFLYEGVDVGDGLDYFNINTYNLPLVEYPSGSQPDTFEEAEQWQAENPNKDVLIGIRQMKEYISPARSYVGDLSDTGNTFYFECGPFILGATRGARVINLLARTKDGSEITIYASLCTVPTDDAGSVAPGSKFAATISGQSSQLVSANVGNNAEIKIIFTHEGYRYEVSGTANGDLSEVCAQVSQSKVYPNFSE